MEILQAIFMVAGSLFFTGVVVMFICVWVSVARETKQGPHISIDYNYPY